MTIKKRIDLGNTTYYVEVEVEYKKKDNILMLCLKNYKDDYYDGGNLSVLLEKLAREYSAEVLKKYNTGIFFLDDALYLYEHIPFIKGVYDFNQNKKDSIPHSIGYISVNELDKIIKDNNIKIKENDNFKLNDERTWDI